jgi:Tfp pilus assembly PilM family ATPase
MPLLLGVDLGSHTVKVTTFRSAGRRAELEDRFSYPVPQNGSPPNLVTRLAALEALLDENPGWSSAVIGMVMQAEEVTFRPMELPFSDKAQVDKTLPFAIEGDSALDLDDMVLAWRSRAVDDKSRAMAIMARRDKVEAYLVELKQRALDPKRVVPEGELHGVYAADGTVAVIDIGHMHTAITVVADGEVRASRSVSVGGWNMTRAIQQALDCEWAEAESLKHGPIPQDGGEGPSGYSKLEPVARKAVDGAIGQLLAEIRSTLIQFEDEHRLDIGGVRLCGGGARIPELQQYLHKDLGLPVERVVDPEGDAPPPRFAASHAMAVLLAGGHDTPVVDLRTGDLSFTGGVNTLRAVLTYGTAGGVFFAIAAVAIFTFQYISLYSELGEVNERIADVVVETFPEVPRATIDSGSKAAGIMRDFTSDTVMLSEKLPPANPQEPPMVDRLYELVKAFPDHKEVPLQIDSIEMLPELITFQGETDGFAQSARLEEALKETELFKGANKDSENRTSKGKVDFKFSVPLGQGESTEEEAG